jgi:hypothetical protein
MTNIIRLAAGLILSITPFACKQNNRTIEVLKEEAPLLVCKDLGGDRADCTYEKLRVYCAPSEAEGTILCRPRVLVNIPKAPEAPAPEAPRNPPKE